MQPPPINLLDETTLANERAVLGACITLPTKLRDCELGTEDFADLRHKLVWGALRELEARREHIDALSVERELQRLGKVDALSGMSGRPPGEFLDALRAINGMTAYVEPSFEGAVAKVRDSAIRRSIALAAGDILQHAGQAKLTAGELLDETTRLFGAIDSARTVRTDAVPIGVIVTETVEAIRRVGEEQEQGGQALTGAPTGIAALDAKVGGWRFKLGNMIAARPGMGKSALGLSTADACSAAGFGVHVFSMEDSTQTYGERAISRFSGVPAIRLRQADIRREEVQGVLAAVENYKSRKNWIVDDRPALSAAEIIRAWRRRGEKNNTRVVLVDYIQLVRSSDPRMREDQALGASLQAMIDAAKIDNVALVVMSQFNRKLEERLDKRPQLSDLRGSGELEEKIKLCVALYRGAYYYPDPIRGIDYDCSCLESVKRCYHAPSMEEFGRLAQALVLKGGNGPTGMVSATWDGPTTNIW
jgi:replicative DNA helicase